MDDLPPSTVITHATKSGTGWKIRGVAADNGSIDKVLVNGQPATPLRDNFAEWEVTLATLSADGIVTASAVDKAGNKEQLAHASKVQ